MQNDDKQVKLPAEELRRAFEIVKAELSKPRPVVIGYQVVDTTKNVVIADNIGSSDRAWHIMRNYVLSKPPMSTRATVVDITDKPACG